MMEIEQLPKPPFLWTVKSCTLCGGRGGHPHACRDLDKRVCYHERVVCGVKPLDFETTLEYFNYNCTMAPGNCKWANSKECSPMLCEEGCLHFEPKSQI